MKKIVSLIALLLLVSAGSAFAVTNVGIAAGADVKAGTASGSEKSIAKLSTGVTAKLAFDTTTYAAATKHNNGTKEFGSSSGDTRIFSKESATLEDLTASDSSAFSSGWSSL